jgi:PilZ domain/Gram-negative bacterial TonB protein C-terminal
MNMHFLPEQFTEYLGSSDRRDRVRRNPPALAYLEVGEGNGGIVLNVSETGLAVAVAQSFNEKEIPLLSFRLPELDRTFQASGEIVWRSESQKTAGIRFVNLAEPDRMQIRNWIRAEIVAAELQTPEERGRVREAAKSVLIMPSPRKVARQAELEAERDEARAAEFDRMFPSEASLNATEPTVETEPNSEIADAAKTENAAKAFLAQEETIQEARKSEAPPKIVEGSEVESAAPPVVEPAADEASAPIDWREEWEQFHRRRDNLHKERTFEAVEPVMMRSIFGESVAQTGRADGATTVAAPAGYPHSKMPGWLAENPVQAIFDHGDVVEGPATPAAELPPVRRKSPLGIATLSMVLIVMCFILGYAIQPGAFQFASAKFADAGKEASASPVEGDLAQPAAAAPAPAPARDAKDSAAVTGETAAAPKDPKEKTPRRRAENSGTSESSADLRATQRPAVEPAPIQPATKTTPAFTPPTAAAAPPATAVAEPPKPTPVSPAPTTQTAPSASNAANANPATYEPALAPVPVSFFPVTAPAGGSPPKLMQLPEETVAETPAFVIRSHQFLFVPAQPGPESTHALERVHIGDRVTKVNPTFPPQGVGNAQSGMLHLRTTIGTDGAVSDVQAISGPTALIPAATAALRQWRYKPTDIDGTPIVVREDVIIEFRPGR